MKKEKVPINFLISKETDHKFRVFLADKYGGYHRGALSVEIENAMINFMEKEGKK